MAYVKQITAGGVTKQVKDPEALEAVAAAKAYDSTSTYQAGDVCSYGGDLYQCKAAITTPEEFTAAHWASITVDDRISALLAAQQEGYLGDLITTDDPNYSVYGNNTTGHRWSFANDAENSRDGKYYYGVYAIPTEVDVIGIWAYNYSDDMAAYGFYAGDPLDGGTKLWSVAGLPANAVMPVPTRVTVPHDATHLVVQLGGGPTTRGLFPFRARPVSCCPVVKYPIYDGIDFGGLSEQARIKHVVVGDDKIIAGLHYSTTQPYRLLVRPVNSRLDNESGTVTRVDIKKMDQTNMGSFRDRGNASGGSIMQIWHMAYYSGYLYICLRVGGAPASGYTNVTNSVLVVVKLSDLSTTAWFESNDRFSTVRILGTKLLVGERAGGFRVYDLTDPAVPVELMHVTDSDITEYQMGCLFTRSGNDYAAFGCYESGLAVYQLGAASATRLIWWHDQSRIASGLTVFAAEVNGNYLYAAIAPTNAKRKAGSRIMGIVVLDITDLTAPVYMGFFPIPEEDCGNWPARITYSSGAFATQSVADPAPNYVRVSGNWLYTNNDDKGLAIFRLSDPANPEFAGNVPLGTWPRYFELFNGLIIAGGDYDYLRGEKPYIAASGMVLA